jgi:hypothetical protein
MVEIDLTDDLIDLICEYVLTSIQTLAATLVAASRLSQVGCVQRASAGVLDRSLFHIVSLLG